MGLAQRLGRNALGLEIVPRLMAGYLHLVFATSRVTIENAEALAPARIGAQPFVATFWHGRLLGPARIFRGFGKRAQVLISSHHDGEIIARTIEAMGYKAIRGSTDRDKRGQVKDKGGMAGLRLMLRSLREGNTVGLTPDGPRGPRMRMSPGVVTLAQLSGLPIVPLAWSSSRAIQFTSWDRFLLPLPFGRIVVKLGDAVHVPRRLDDAHFRVIEDRLEQTLNALCAGCDTEVGRPVVEPAPLPERMPAA